MVLVGNLSHSENLLRTFYTAKSDLLDRYAKNHKEMLCQLECAFAYWVLCALGRCRENDQKYGILTRSLIGFSKKLWKELRSYARKIAQKIRYFQKSRQCWFERVYLLKSLTTLFVFKGSSFFEKPWIHQAFLFYFLFSSGVFLEIFS